MVAPLPAQQTALADHQHPRAMPGSVGIGALDSTVYSASNPSTIDPDDTASAGVATTLARSDHQHPITAATASTLTDTNAEGSAASFARSDHDHALPANIGKGGGSNNSASATTDSSTVTTETVVLTITNFVFKDGRAYRVKHGSAVVITGATGEIAFQFRKTDATGTIYGAATRIQANSLSTTCDASQEWYVKRSAGSDLTTTVVLTLQKVTAGITNVAHRGTATLPRYLLIEDIGQASDYAFAVAVT